MPGFMKLIFLVLDRHLLGGGPIHIQKQIGGPRIENPLDAEASPFDEPAPLLPHVVQGRPLEGPGNLPAVGDDECLPRLVSEMAATRIAENGKDSRHRLSQLVKHFLHRRIEIRQRGQDGRWPRQNVHRGDVHFEMDGGEGEPGERIKSGDARNAPAHAS